MTGKDDPAASFDPRTWTRGGSGTAAAPPASFASFNPKSWLVDEAPAGASVSAAPEEPAREPTLRLSLRTAPRWTRIAAAASALAICSAGGVAAYLSRQDPAPQQGPTGPAAPAPGPEAAPASVDGGGGSRTLNIGDPGQIKAALLYAGLPGLEAQRIAGQAVVALGDVPGEIRLSFNLASSGAGVALAQLEATRLDGSGVTITPQPNGGYRAETLAAKLEIKTFAESGEMDETSFYTSAVAAGIKDSLISDFAKAFSFDFDFQREINAGDRFEAVYQQAVNPSGQPVGDPRLIYVSMTTPQKSRRFYRFTGPGEKEPGWFDDNGRSTVRDLMRTPVDGARVTSRFGNRVHPISGFVKAHKGIDFGAPTGTPIYSAGSGVVAYAGFNGSCPKCGAGNMVKVQHDNGWATNYFHLSAFAPGLAVGQRVSQGQVIGLVGSTGGSTGPHLHYEVIIGGEKVDPLSVPTGTGTSLGGPALDAFRKERDRIDLARSQQVG